ncbi:hypothetical protein MferCBS31731_002278 [Microsporum ferrugineum]
MASNEEPMADLATSIRHEFRVCMEKKDLMCEKWAEVRMSDFNLWVAGVGATAGKKASLDARLQALPDELSTLKYLLSSLKNSLQDCQRLHGNEIEESMEVVDLIIENLAMLATVIRRTGKRSHLKRVDLTFDPQRQTRLRRHFECIVLLRPAKPAKNALFRPAVSPPTTAEDWMNVVPNYIEGGDHLTPLQTRLIDANLRRRYRFLCAQRHSEKLAGHQTSAGPRASPARVGIPTRSAVEGDVLTPSVAPSSKPVASPEASKDADRNLATPGPSTAASTVEITNSFIEGKASIRRTPQTRITAITASTQYPRLLKPCDNERKKHKILKCPCCCQPQPETMAENTDAWKQHLVDDISPYTCIADDCPTPHILYSTRRDWENHVKTEHRPNRWICPICNHAGAIFSGLEAFTVHMQNQHADVLPMDGVETLLHWSAMTSYGLTCCPLCDSSGSLDAPELIDHILQHTHDFALRALPWPKHRVHARNLPGTYDLEIPNADIVKSWLDDVSEHTTGLNTVQLDLRSWDRASTQEPNECGGFDYFHENDYFADCSSSLPLATLSVRSNIYSHHEALLGHEETTDRDIDLEQPPAAHKGLQVGHITGTVVTHSHQSVERSETIPSPGSTIPFLRDRDFVMRETILNRINEKAAPGYWASQHELAEAYQANGQVKEAVRLLEHIVKVHETTLAEDHPSRLASQRELAEAYQANGQVKEAMRLLEHIVKVYETTLAEDHPSRLASQHKLAEAYQANGQVKEAVRLLEHIVKVYETILAKDYPSRLASQRELAEAYQANGQIKEAVQLLEHVGAYHLSILDTVNLGNLYKHQDKLAESEDMYQLALQGYQKALGTDHPLILDIVNNLGNLYKHQGKLAEAEDMYQRALQGYQKMLGADHPSTLNIVNNFGNLYKHQGKLAEAEDMYQRALQGYQKILGADHPSTLDIVNNLGNLYKHQGKLAEAEDIY